MALRLQIDELTIAKHMNDYTDGDGWKPNIADKNAVCEIIKILNNVPDNPAQILAGLEFIRTFNHDGVIATEWLKAIDLSHGYSPEYMDALKNLVNIWHQKLRGIKTYVFINEIISYIIHELNAEIAVMNWQEQQEAKHFLKRADLY